MLNKTKEIVKDWSDKLTEKIEINAIYMFGSAIYKDGRMFDPLKSDLDLIMVIPSSIQTSMERKNWIKEVKLMKMELERDLLFFFNKHNTQKEIVSIVPITYTELKYNIHKSGSRNFFSVNEFLNINEDSIFKGDEYFNFEPTPNELITQVFNSIQKARNKFLKNSANTDLCELDWCGEGVLPKELAREAAKIFSLNEQTDGDEFNTSLGSDFIKQRLRDLRNFDSEYLDLYTWIDARNGGRSNPDDKDNLKSENHLLMYEVLFDLTMYELHALEGKGNTISNKIEISVSFMSFLQDMGLVSKAHSEKEQVTLDDIFVYPELKKYDDQREYEETGSSKYLLKKFKEGSKILIAGDGQSGKTTLCKKMFIELFKLRYIPIYVSDKGNAFLGKMQNKILEAFKNQYKTKHKIDEFDKDKFVIIVDDFHFANKKEKILNDIDSYNNQILVVDDVFVLNFKDEKLINSYTHYKTRELIPSLRNELIKNWLKLSDDGKSVVKDNDFYQNIDKNTELINTTLGKVLGGGVMPAFPFFILTVMSTNEAFSKPLDQDITSQGYCYQALIYMYFRKQGVKNDEIDTYINFLTEIAYYFYKKNTKELSNSEFYEFTKQYFIDYNLPIKLKTIIKTLQNTNILHLDNLNNYSFCYLYLFYFFVGKYLAENLIENKVKINSILENLQKNENAYIAIFISHHTKDNYILDEILLNSWGLFEGEESSTLNTNELSYFDKNSEKIIKAILPNGSNTPEKERENALKRQDKIESTENTNRKNVERSTSKPENDTQDFEFDIRRAIKTVEVMGTIIKNRAGSLKMERLETIFEEGMLVHLRILKTFIDTTSDEQYQNDFVNHVTNKIHEIIEEKGKPPKRSDIKKIAKDMFWNANFGLIYIIINKIIQSLGSNQLINVVESVCKKINTPASFIIQHGILLQKNKNLQINTIAEKFKDDDFSDTAKLLLKHIIVNYSRTHTIGYHEKKRIQNDLQIPSKVLLKNISHED